MHTYSKLDGEWCIRSETGGLDGRTVTATKRSGATSQVTLGAKVGEAFGQTYYAIAQAPRAAAQPVGDLSAIIAMFDRARAHLKFPAIVLNGFRVNVAGDRAREPGSLTVTTTEKFDGKRKWLGRVTLAGEYQPSRDADPGIGTKLRAFAADPVGFAGDYGRLHGICCFCSKALTDERSTAVGYGPKCATNYGLPWGATEEVA